MKKKNVEAEIAGVVDKIQHQLAVLENKIDILISRSSPKPAEIKPVQRNHGNNYAQRVLHKAVCADCRKECEVPFKPTGDRPVYCKDCFSKRRTSSGPFKARPDNRPGAIAAAQAVHITKPEPVIKKKAAGKKPAAKKRKPKAR